MLMSRLMTPIHQHEGRCMPRHPRWQVHNMLQGDGNVHSLTPETRIYEMRILIDMMASILEDARFVTPTTNRDSFHKTPCSLHAMLRCQLRGKRRQIFQVGIDCLPILDFPRVLSSIGESISKFSGSNHRCGLCGVLCPPSERPFTP